MSQIDKDIVEAFNSLRAFLDQVRLMLQTADGAMHKSGWKNAHGSKVFAATTALYKPARWLPTHLVRIYTHPDTPTILAFVAVVVGNIERPDTANEAIVTAGWLNYGKAKPGKKEKIRYARLHLFSGNRKDDGTICFRDLSKGSGELPASVTQAASFAYPLSDVDNGSELHTKVISKLLSELRKETGVGI